MSTMKSYLSTKHLMEKLPADKKARLLSYLSTTSQENYRKTPALPANPLHDLSIHGLLGKIHPSHFVRVFSSLVHETKIFYLSALPAHVKREVAKTIGVTEPLYEFYLSFAEAICHEVFLLLSEGEEPILPLSYFPADPLLFLAEASSLQLSTLTTYLGLFDLFEEIKQLIDAKLLLKLQEALSKEEISLMHEIERWRGKKISFGMIGLSRWNGDISMLRNVIKERGINRLAKASVHSSKDLIWLISHIMEIGMKSELLKYRAEMGDRLSVEALLEQVNYCWKKV